jgi:hypothetical protein
LPITGPVGDPKWISMTPPAALDLPGAVAVISNDLIPVYSIPL